MNYTSSDEMGYLYLFFSSFKWWELAPSSHLIKNQREDELQKTVLAKNLAGTLAVAYLPCNTNIAIDMSAFTTNLKARWFNPSDNSFIKVNVNIVNSGIMTFVPQDREDWLLVLEKVSETE